MKKFVVSVVVVGCLILGILVVSYGFVHLFSDSETRIFSAQSASPNEQSFDAAVALDYDQLVEQVAPIEVYGRSPEGDWQILDPEPKTESLPAMNLRRSAMSILGRMGIRYLAAPTGQNFGYAPVGEALAERPGEWGVELLEKRENVYLYRLR